ncbi:MAG TPA: hemolysin III family protein [Halanaerobiales bacterium]|nr:hemolysin III family protein [Halanaerobiales bacterium]
MGNLIEYSKKEEIANAITHGLGIAFGIFALVFLILTHYKTTDVYGLVSYIVYGVSLIILYLSSTLYHSIPIKKAKIHLRRLDHASIFILIAGTYTPISMVALRGKLGWTILITIWSIALLGIIFKVFFINKFKILSVIMYLAMGWLIIFAIKPLIVALSTKSLVFLIIGGLFYTVGILFYALQSVGFKYSHSIWHLFVLAGSIFHFIMIYLLN